MARAIGRRLRGGNSFAEQMASASEMISYSPGRFTVRHGQVFAGEIIVIPPSGASFSTGMMIAAHPELKVPTTPIWFDGALGHPMRSPPALGQDSATVLGHLLGYDEARIRAAVTGRDEAPAGQARAA